MHPDGPIPVMLDLLFASSSGEPVEADDSCSHGVMLPTVRRARGGVLVSGEARGFVVIWREVDGDVLVVPRCDGRSVVAVCVGGLGVGCIGMWVVLTRLRRMLAASFGVDPGEGGVDSFAVVGVL